MKAAFIILSLGVIVGCSQEPPEVTIAEKFWSAMAANDREAIKHVLTDPEHMQYLEGWDVDIDEDGYRLGGLSDAGVEITWFDDCYTDVMHPTVMGESGGEPRVDLGRTIASMFEADAKKKPVKQYCHEFSDQPMQGRLNGQSWTAHHVNRQIYDFGTHKKTALKIVSEPCPDDRCIELSSPQLNISNLDYSGTGGNFDMKTNITLYTPPSTNEFITEGSYRISRTPGGQAKLEISFQKDDGDAINGFVVFDLAYLDGM